MKIVRERPCQRRHHRLVAPLYVNYKEEKRLLAKDWSVGGLAFTVEKDHLPQICERIDLTLTLPFKATTSHSKPQLKSFELGMMSIRLAADS